MSRRLEEGLDALCVSRAVYKGKHGLTPLILSGSLGFPKAATRDTGK